MDRLHSMAAFAKAVETGSFAAAADALDMSPQMVAKHVAYLEARLGTRLLNRTTRRQSLTPIGGTYYERCKLVLADAEWAEAAAEEARGAPSGRLRINAPVSFGTHALVPLVTPGAKGRTETNTAGPTSAPIRANYHWFFPLSGLAKVLVDRTRTQ
jgi:DNA-binding transcriptional LysR family regulator